MTRRVAAALLVLTLAILVAAVVPLALGAIAHERDSFVEDTARTAASIAGIAEARLGDNVADDPALSAALVTAARQGDELLLLNSHGRVVVSQGIPQNAAWRQLVAQSTLQNDPTTELTNDRVIAVQTVWDDGKLSGTAIGTVVLERPTGPLNQNIANLWLYLVGLSGAAMAAAVLIAIYFARWVSRPLARLDTAARKIADGDLTVRAKTGYGPPELRRMAATFNMMAGRLEALVHGHRAMLADASHQLRTPLTALRLRLDLLAADSAPAAAAELAGAQEEIARLSRLVDGLLATARAEAVTEQLEQIDVMEAVSERVAAWQPVADGNGVKLMADAPSPAPAAARRPRRRAPGADPRQPARQRDRGHRRRGRHRPGLGREVGDRHHADRRRRRPRHDPARAVPRLPAVHHRQPERHRARPRHRAPAGHRQRRDHQARRHPGRRADRRGGVPRQRRAVAGRDVNALLKVWLRTADVI